MLIRQFLNFLLNILKVEKFFTLQNFLIHTFSYLILCLQRILLSLQQFLKFIKQIFFKHSLY